MKGLIIKDIMCLRKQLTVFTYVIISVLLVSIMYVLSAKFGNIALAGKEMLATNDMSTIDIKNVGTMALVFFMLLPIATVGDMAIVFEVDGKAEFYKIAGAFPLSLKERLLSRYLSIYALFGIGVVIDVFIAFLLSLLTDLISFKDFLGIILSSASIMSIYSSLVIFYCILLGYGKESYSQLFSIITICIALILINIGKVKNIITEIANSSLVTEKSTDSALIWQPLDFIKEKAWILFLAAAFVSLLSYMASLLVAERKRGVI